MEEINKMPPNQGKRDKKRPNYNYIPLEFDDELASIFEEGRKPRPGMPKGYSDSWMLGGKDFLEDCLNHAFWHLKMYMKGDRSENHLAKVAWNSLVVRYHELKKVPESFCTNCGEFYGKDTHRCPESTRVQETHGDQ
jgi:hypothetical protein